MSKPPYCHNGGYLVGAKDKIPDDPQIYYKKSDPWMFGCNRIFCSRCRVFVRHWPGYRLAKGPWSLTEADHEELYRTNRPETSPLLKRSNQDRTYSCKCWSDNVNSPVDLRVGYMDFDHWGCAGHPQKEADIDP